MQALFLCFCLLFFNCIKWASNASAELPPDRLQQLGQKIEDIKKQQLSLEGEIKSLGQKSTKLSSQISNLDLEITKLAQETLELNSSYGFAEQKVIETSQRVEEVKKLSSLRLRAYYSSSSRNVNFLPADTGLIKSDSKMFFYFKKLRDFEIESLQELKRLLEQLESQNIELHQARLGLSLAQDKLISSRKELEVKKIEANKLQEDLRKAKTDNSKLLSQLRAEMLRIETALRSLSSLTQDFIGPQPIRTTEPEAVGIGLKDFFAPLDGIIISSFGSKLVDTAAQKVASQGLGFAANEGSPVHAVGQARVVFAGRLGDYGQVVILDHGQRVHTLYGLLSSISVNLGQSVQAGDLLGTVGKITAPKPFNFYFELRIEGKPQDPSTRLLSS